MPSGATIRSSRDLPSAVLSAMTSSVRFGRSSAMTFWTSAHCSLFAPGGVSQRICQSPNVFFTTPCAPAVPAAAVSAAAKAVQTHRERNDVISFLEARPGRCGRAAAPERAVPNTGQPGCQASCATGGEMQCFSGRYDA